MGFGMQLDRSAARRQAGRCRAGQDGGRREAGLDPVEQQQQTEIQPQRHNRTRNLDVQGGKRQLGGERHYARVETRQRVERGHPAVHLVCTVKA